MDQTPVRPDLDVSQQPFNRSRAQSGLDLGDFGNLFGNVDMHRPVRGKGGDLRQNLAWNRAQRMGRDTDAKVPRRCTTCGCGRLQQLFKPLRIVAESVLTACKRAPVASALRIIDRQMRKADPALHGGLDHGQRHLGDMVIGLAVALVMQIVKLAHGSEPGFQHLHLRECCDCAYVHWGQNVQKTVHQLAPRPETVVCASAPGFGHPGHGPLKRMGMEVARRGQGDVQRRPRRGLLRAHFADPAIPPDVDSHVFLPSLGRKCLCCPESFHLFSRVDNLI